MRRVLRNLTPDVDLEVDWTFWGAGLAVGWRRFVIIAGPLYVEVYW